MAEKLLKEPEEVEKKKQTEKIVKLGNVSETGSYVSSGTCSRAFTSPPIHLLKLLWS